MYACIYCERADMLVQVVVSCTVVAELPDVDLRVSVAIGCAVRLAIEQSSVLYFVIKHDPQTPHLYCTLYSVPS